ncbi:carboxymuconolactone decarboxylase family protein, partial [Acinetobacter junii]|uniref:carboxymuconolactone decarboxylase family protein n=1 Tax=Acinetobacter junii TaxID=40215 RepID=UPI001D1809B6
MISATARAIRSRVAVPKPPCADAALTGYLQLSAASAQGGLGTATLERIALAVAEINGCDYCLAA